MQRVPPRRGAGVGAGRGGWSCPSKPSPATQPHVALPSSRGIAILDAGDAAGGCPTPGRGLSPRGPAGSTLPSPCFTPSHSPWAGGAQTPGKVGFSSFSLPPPHPLGLTPAMSAQPALSRRSRSCWESGGQRPAHDQIGHPNGGIGDIFPQDHPLLPLRVTAKNPNK